MVRPFVDSVYSGGLCNGATMDPKLTDTDEFIIVGVRAVLQPDAEAFASVWREKFLPRQEDLPMIGGYYCVFNPLPRDPKKRWEFVAGRKTDSLEDIPTGMVGWIVPSGTYASAGADGLANLRQSCDAITTFWLPDSGYRRVSSPMFASCAANPVAPGTVWQVGIPVETPETLAQIESWLGERAT